MTKGDPIPRRMDPASRRVTLLDAAMAHFDVHGIDVPLEAVARAAGISPPLMRRYFKTRDGLLLALFLDRLPELTKIFSAPEVALHDQLDAYLGWIAPHSWAHHLWVTAVHDPGRDPELRAAVLATRRGLIERTAGASWDEMDAGRRLRAQIFVAGFESAISDWLHSGQPDRQTLITGLMEVGGRLGLAAQVIPLANRRRAAG